MSENPAMNVSPASPSLTEQEILAAAVNSPSLSDDEFVLGEFTYKVVHLPYDDYVSFLAYLQPFLDGIIGKLSEKNNVSLPGITLSEPVDMGVFVRFCGKSLPEMARLVCKQTRSEVTIDEIKQAAGNPFVLAALVFKQINKNQMIQTFASFFAQLTHLIKPRK
jgi:hypothetical protein